ncbi:sigma-70 family RNA polymerase sigma factor [Geosporobacter ferrireducens]|uniref:RNA polymerase subunit sigma-24 n=1 Tax=Geosporobacter ferrireducens TaxID=1424294 RepID=A0A1D8GD96_9FIRM|nr:sigma-70 family RNA polymerase sigma factor [Geosporobacter ferrireducens]AOT68866.1 RNA polymerase subunit sigma-24 [Geosporobacter ferrireducens]MTI54901.1 sigma-70 family RNA polymerase sigma factor [Geosporobacter ferrireducens]
MDIEFLIKKAKKGDREALLTLIMERKNEHYRLAYAYLNNQEDALDAMEDMILRIYDKIHQLKKPKAFYSWSNTILVNCCRDILRKKKKLVLLESYGEEVYMECYEQSEQQLDLEKYLVRLNPDQQEALRLRYFLDLDYQTIAELTSVPLGTVKSRIANGLKKLKESFGGVYE